MAKKRKNKVWRGVTCPYCNQKARLVSGRELPFSAAARPSRRFWLCEPCQAWVGCHKGNNAKPMGTPAKARLRRLRQDAHNAFDPLWKSKCKIDGISRSKGRSEAYKWLAGMMNIQEKQCHIGYFNEAQCVQVLNISKRLKKVIKHQI